MKLIRGLAELGGERTPSAVAIGKFDGVHAGHRAIIAELERLAAPEQLRTVVITFDRHPLAVLDPANCPTTLTSVEQKIGLIAETGIDACMLVEFTPEFAALPAEDFVEQYLVAALDARLVLVGSDFRFGTGGRGNVELLRELGQEHGFAVHVINDVMLGEARASSTRIRGLLTEGDVAGAGDVLGHVPTMRGMVVHGAKRGRELGYPTANLEPAAQGFVPADGVYAGWLWDGGVRFPAAISVGNNPTFEGVPAKQVEAYVLDRDDLDLYDHIVDVQFVDRIRGQVAFTGIEPLIRQIADDVERVRAVLANCS